MRFPLILGGILLASCLIRIPLANMPLERDEGEYAYIAWDWSQGHPPYADSFDQKLPLVFAIYRAVLRISDGSPAAFHWAAQAFVCLTLLALFFLGRELASERAGLAAAALAVPMLADSSVLGQSANTEVFLILPATLGLLCAVQSARRTSQAWALASGFCVGLAFLCKQPALLYLAGVGGWFLARRDSRRLLLGTALGFLLPLAVTVEYFSAAHALRALWESALAYNVQYSAAVRWRDYWWQFWPPLLACVCHFWIACALALALFIRGVRGLIAGERSANREILLVTAWLVLSCAAVSSGGFFRPHYFLLIMPPLALLAGIALDAAPWKKIAPRISMPLVYGLLAAMQLVSLSDSAWYYWPGPVAKKSAKLYQFAAFAASPRISGYIAKHADPQDRVLVFGNEPEVLYQARRRSATRYIFLAPLQIESASAEAKQRELFDELRTNEPKLIVTYFQIRMKEFAGGPAYLYDALRGFLRERGYRVQAVAVENGSYGYDIIEGDAALDAWRANPAWPDNWLTPDRVVIWSR